MYLYSTVIKLINLFNVSIMPPGGQHAHGAFFHIIEQIDPALSARLHEIEGKGARKPFTISPIMGLPKLSRSDAGDSGRKNIHLREGWECWMRITILNESLFKSFIEFFLNQYTGMAPFPRGNREIRLGDAHFLVSEILSTPGSHPWAGFSSIEELWQLREKPPPDRIAFQFTSPTSFNLSKDKIELLPYPKLVFGNLATAWRAICNENIVVEIEQFAQANLSPEIHRLERKALYLHNRPQLGMVGRVDYDLSHIRDHPQTSMINMLANFAFYSGVGRKTAQGMGMTRLLDSSQ